MANLTWWNDWVAGWPVAAAEVSVRAAVLLAAAWLLCYLLRRQPAALRHIIWVTSLAAVAATPFLLDVTPKLRIATGWADSEPSGVAMREPVRSGEPGFAQASEPSFVTQLSGPSVAAAPPEESAPADFEATTPAAAARSTDAGTPPPLALILAGVWAFGCFFFTARLATGHIRLRLMARQARGAENFEGLTRQLGVRRGVRFLQSSAETMPMTWGWSRPRVLLPGGFTKWDQQRRSMTVLHELAHIKRADWLTQTFAQLVCAAFWFHPLVWFALRRIRVEADRACDDIVLAAGSKASGYAEHLVEAARQFRGAGVRPWVAIAMAHPSSLDQRVRYVLDKDVDRAGVGLGRGFAAAVAIAAIAVGVPSVEAVEKKEPAGHAPEATVEVADPAAGERVQPAAAGMAEKEMIAAADPVAGEPILMAQAEPQPEPEPDPSPQLERAQERLEEAQRRLEERRERAEERAQRAAERAERRRPQLSPQALQTAAAALRKALSSPDAEVRAEAAESLGRLGAFDEASLEALEAALSDEEPEVRHEAAKALGRLVRQAKQMPPEEAMRRLTPALNSSDAGVRREAVEALQGLGGTAAIEAATRAMDDADPGVQREAVESLGRLLRSSDPEAARGALPSLQRALQHNDPQIRKEVVEALGKLRSIANDVVPLLAEAAEDPDPEVQKAAVEALGKLSRRGGYAEAWRDEVHVEFRDRFEMAPGQFASVEVEIEEQMEEIEEQIREFDYGTYRNIGPPGEVGAGVGPGGLASPEEE